MLFIRVLKKILLITAACQSLTIHQSSQNKPKINDYKKFKFLNSTNIYPVQYPYNNLWTATHPKTYSNANEQPVIGVSLESEILPKPKGVSEINKKTLSLKNNNNNYHFNAIKRASPLAKDKQKLYPKYIVRKQRNLNKNHDDKLIEQNNEVIKYVNNEDDRHNTTTTNTASLSTSLSKQPSVRSSHEIRYLHDIFFNYPKPQHVNFGHVELSPVLFEKRFETQKAGNRYKGEMMWLDNTGGFAHHYWDLALGKV